MKTNRNRIQKAYTQSEIRKILSSVPDIVGWEFSYMNKDRQAVPWEYQDVASVYIQGSHTVLDIGTGDGKRFAQFSSSFSSGVGIDLDPEMISLANKLGLSNTKFTVSDYRLGGITESFDVILNRHTMFDLEAIAQHLHTDGYFVSQQVGERNMYNIRTVIEGGSISDMPTITKASISSSGLRIVAFMEYDVAYEVQDIESLLFWLNALDMLHTGMDGSSAVKDISLLNALLDTGYNDQRKSFVTNEHRYLVVAQKQ